MSKTAKRVLGRYALAAAAAVVVLAVAQVRVQAAFDAYLKIEGLDGGSKDPAHMGWMEITRVVAGDLNGDAMADRESSAPSVSELTVRKAGGGNMAPNIGSQSSGAGAGKTTAGGAGAGKASTNNAMTNSTAIQAPRDTATGQATGRRMHKPLVITKEMDAASPKLFQACATGQHFPKAQIEMRKAGGSQEYLRYDLTDVMISSCQKSSGGERPTETITLNYTKIEIQYRK